MTKAQKVAQDEARETLRKLVKPGDTVYTVLRHVSRSGMSRGIDVYALTCDDGVADRRWLSRLVSRACGIPFDERRECLKVGGCGMDMGFHVVYEMSHALYSDGFGCIGERCPSNDHSNGDWDYTPHATYLHDKAQREKIGKGPSIEPHWHTSGGYALHHQWL